MIRTGRVRFFAITLCLASGPACGLAASGPLPTQDPSLPGIAFVGGPVVERLEDEYAGAYHWRDGYVYPKGATYNAWERTISTPRPGRNLFALVPATPEGKLTQLTFLKDGNVWDPEPSYDGKKILFSMRKDDEDWFHLFEINIDGTGLTQLTDGPFNDVSGVYLPDGWIVFCSDRTGVLDEYHEERSEFLFRIKADGTEIEQLTFVPGIYFEPTVLQNGLILCSFWDAFHISVAPFIKHETYLITLRPDGTEERHLFGAGEHKFYNRTRHSAIGLTRPGQLPDGRILVQSEMGPSIYDPNLGTALGLTLAPVFPGTASAQTGGTTHAIHLSPLGTRTSPYPLPDGRFLMSATLPGSRDLGIYVVDPATRAMQPVFDRPNLSEWDAVPIGLPRPTPDVLPDKLRNKNSEMATFVVAAGRHSDTPERNELNQRARFVRVIQAEYTEVTTSSHTSLETRILGTVPVLPDGSIAFEAPAETPLFLETLDARGHRLVLQAGYMAARAGEVKSCTGCHAPQTEAVANAKLQALDFPLPRVERDSTDLSYRRNDPDEYRRQAIVTQATEYRKWLASPIADVRRRGLEMLAFLPDEVTAADRERIVELLHDESPDVRRQAAFALAMVGSADEIPALIAVVAQRQVLPPLGRGGQGGSRGMLPTREVQDDAKQADRSRGGQAPAQRPPLPPLPKGGRRGLEGVSSATDWQTVHYALMALEAITGENLDLAADIERSPGAWLAWWQHTESVENFLKRLAERGNTIGTDFERDAWLEAVGRTRWLSGESSRLVAAAQRALWQTCVRELLAQPLATPAVVRAAGMLSDADALPLLAPLLVRAGLATAEESCPDCDDALQREIRATAVAKEAALALGRIGGQAAIDLLWEAVVKNVPNSSPIPTRHYQSGPRPEEYTYLRALIYAGAVPKPDHVPCLVALLPYTEGEKPRFEDRTKIDSQRVWLGRILLERAGLRASIVKLATAILEGKSDARDPLYKQVLIGTNIDRPRSEHGRNFPVLKQLAPEQALHLLACLTEDQGEIPEPLVAPLLRSNNHRERIEAAVIFRKFGFSTETERILRDEASQAYAFREIWSIGKGRPDTQFRDKSYFLMALAAHARDLDALSQFTDYTRFYRDIRLGLALGLGFRGKSDGYPLLEKLANDPIFSVHREAANAAVQIHGVQQIAGQPVARLTLPPRRPLKPEYRAPGAYSFSDTTPEPTTIAGTIRLDLHDPQVVLKALQSVVDAAQYKNVGNGFARNAERMRLFDAGELSKILDGPVATAAPLTPELEQALNAAIESPYPFAHYLASRLIAVRQERQFGPVLARKLPAYVAATDTVGFYWAADTLGRLCSSEGIEPLSQVAAPKTFDRTYGPVGMAYGYAAARALGMIIDDPQSPEIAALLASPNVWLQTGVLEGRVERGDLAAVRRLEGVLSDPSSAILEATARRGLKVLSSRDNRRAEREP